MREVEAYSLGPHDGWSCRARLFHGGAPTGTLVCGHEVRRQYAVADDRHLLIVDGGPSEGVISVLLLDPAHRIIARRRFGLLWMSQRLTGADVIDDRTIDLGFESHGWWRVEVRDVRSWRLGSLLGVRRLTAGTRDPDPW